MASASSFCAQYQRLARGAGDDSLVFFPVGRFIEFYGPQRHLAARALGLKGTAFPRAGYAFRAGFPLELSTRYALVAIRQGLTVVGVRQLPTPLRLGSRPRLPCAVLIPA